MDSPEDVLEALHVKEGGKLTLVPNDKGFQLSVEDAEFAAQKTKDAIVSVPYQDGQGRSDAVPEKLIDLPAGPLNHQVRVF